MMKGYEKRTCGQCFSDAFYSIRFVERKIFSYLCTRNGNSAIPTFSTIYIMIKEIVKLPSGGMAQSMQKAVEPQTAPAEGIHNVDAESVELVEAEEVSAEDVKELFQKKASAKGESTGQTDSAAGQDSGNGEEAASDAESLDVVHQYMNERYELRNNMIAGRLEFRPRDGKDSPFRQLTLEAENSIIIAAMTELGDMRGLKSLVQLLVHSEEVPTYDPAREYLTTLPHWDGQNRMAKLFGRLPGISAENILRCTMWLRSAVAHWLRLDTLYGNDTVPTLIGDQGCGKTVFCRRLLPPTLQCYFLDRINLSNKFDKDMALTNNLVVMLDEFDHYTVSQQAALKQVLSRNTVNARPILKGAQVQRHRYASFMATTNNLRPLNDPTGSRRYVCIRLTPGAVIDNERPIDYDQLYAQVMEEVTVMKKRYWFNSDETRQIQLDNVPFQRQVDVCEMVDACFCKPKAGQEGDEYSMNDIVELIAIRYPFVTCNMALKMRVGSELRRQGYQLRHHKSGNSYVVKPKMAA